MRDAIRKFDGTMYSFLSNFYDGKTAEDFNGLVYNGIHYNTSEAAFQAQKSLVESERLAIAEMTASQSKKAAGRRGFVVLRPDWEEVKDQIMYEIVLAKFQQNPKLLQRLLATEDAELIEGTMWHDNYWGDCYCSKCTNKVGQNHLGKILMRVREEIRKQAEEA